MSQEHGQDSNKDPGRPSFESWWKRSKDVLKTRKITFVQAASQLGFKPSSLSSVGTPYIFLGTHGRYAAVTALAASFSSFCSPDTMLFKTKIKTEEDQDASSSQSPQDKAKARRAQVRKAQIEHRQRKANYVKELEIDVARIRNMIAASQMEIRLLQAENDAMRSQLAAGAAPLPPSTSQVRESTAGELPQDIDMSFLNDIQLDNLDDVTMSLGVDEISSEPTSSAFPANTHFNPLHPPDIPELPHHPLDHISPGQTQQIINFILALEHICWDHFRPSNFQPDVAEPFGPESGHTLMATSLALRTAPGAVFDFMTAQPPPPQQPPSALAARLTATAEAEPPEPPPPISWPASGLTLHSLYRLANSVNPSDLELAPVQAWFELAERYPLEILLRNDVMDRLKREFIGVVKCPHYGAAIERGAFESICARILDPEVVALRGR
ncbi:hypothetical protein CONLIGDRAFT_689256 [Coniochaeta ligniaria NRRL 30616]|uniref:Putative transcription factor kapC n=1 Tax=Coniochaeta ligniaria NRRL 30616 TaxID=1408157 RepID=A0A1J7K4B5_9PEZI|nr:hypothetical protein CONLIGDRAFT_689256 [Coniochaeta ligniaria NRRL 30616]